MTAFDFNAIQNAIPQLIKGIEITIFVSLTAGIIAFCTGLLFTYLRTLSNVWIDRIITGYIEFTRNTPLLVQLYFFYKALPSAGISLSPVLCGILALSIYTGAYITEILRAGVNSISSEQYYAGRGLGLSNMQVFQMIIFPQAIKIVIPPLGSQFINVIKNSSLVSFIAVTDIFYVIYKNAVDDFRFLEFFIIGALIYMGLTGIVALIFNRLEVFLALPHKKSAGEV